MALDSGFDMVGIVDSHQIGASTALSKTIVLALVTPDRSAEFVYKVEIDGRVQWSKWIYERLQNGARKLTLALRDIGIRADPLEFERSWEVIDLRRAAVQAGLGIMGENNLVLNREWGPRLRFTAVFADIDVDLDHPLETEICRMCAICVRECPTKAIDGVKFDRSECLAEFDSGPEMKQRQSRQANYLTEFTKEQCSLCITTCPFGMFNDLSRVDDF